MRTYRIRPKEYISERFIQDYYDYTKKEALKKYREEFPQFTLKELIIE
jgi:hypothetical protein